MKFTNRNIISKSVLVRLTLTSLLLGVSLGGVGCMADGDGGMFVGAHVYGNNVETTLGKVNRDQQSATRSPDKNYRAFDHTLGGHNSNNIGSFRRHEN